MVIVCLSWRSVAWRWRSMLKAGLAPHPGPPRLAFRSPSSRRVRSAVAGPPTTHGDAEGPRPKPPMQLASVETRRRPSSIHEEAMAHDVNNRRRATRTQRIATECAAAPGRSAPQPRRSAALPAARDERGAHARQRRSRQLLPRRAGAAPTEIPSSIDSFTGAAR